MTVVSPPPSTSTVTPVSSLQRPVCVYLALKGASPNVVARCTVHIITHAASTRTSDGAISAAQHRPELRGPGSPSSTVQAGLATHPRLGTHQI